MMFSVVQPLSAAEKWSGNKVAISLSYDDALNSQLDNAVPELNKRGLKASFYIVPLSDGFKSRIDEWRLLAVQGHELGNHSLFHACSKSKPGREWVDSFNALDDKTVKGMVNEITVANTLLTSLDGLTQRTYTIPCGDEMVKDGNYVDAINTQFVAVKGLEKPDFAVLITPNGITSSQIIDFIENQPPNIKLVNVLFHGIGGDHLVTSAKEHGKFLDYLMANQNKYWIDTYRNIMLAEQSKQP